MSINHRVESGVLEIVVDTPPVNALPVAEWFELARILRSIPAHTGYTGGPAEVRAVLLRAEGRGFNAGVDIKEMQASEGHGALVGANRGCYAAFSAVYHCPVPVVAAVNGYCLGGGIGLVGNADVIVASEDASFGLPEVDRGALGAATHLARLVPQHKMRAMVYTCARASAAELHAWGSVLKVVPREALRDEAFAVAAAIAAKPAAVIRAAKASLNGIDPIDVDKSYRYEQGFTFELNLIGEGDRARDAFVSDEDSGKDSGKDSGDE